MAGGAPSALPTARTHPVNRATLLNLFKQDLGDLLEEIEHTLAKPNRDPYAEVNPERRPHEHDTRLLFVDELLSNLGWKRGAGGNVLEEARLQGATTKFMDYVGYPKYCAPTCRENFNDKRNAFVTRQQMLPLPYPLKQASP